MKDSEIKHNIFLDQSPKAKENAEKMRHVKNSELLLALKIQEAGSRTRE